MKRKPNVWILVLASVACVGSHATAASKVSPALESARKTFATAIAAHDLKRLVDLTRFPLAVEMTNYPHSVSSSRFRTDKTVFTDFFGTPDPQTVRCIATEPLVLQNDRTQFGFESWYVDCNGNEYFFSPAGSNWRFSGYENINEWGVTMFALAILQGDRGTIRACAQIRGSCHQRRHTSPR